MKKSCLSLLLAVLSVGVFSPAVAASYHLVTPMAKGSAAPNKPLSLSLVGATLPVAHRGKPYTVNLHDYLTVTGDSQYQPALVDWLLSSGDLPPGLSLDAQGILSGSATTKTGTPQVVDVTASYTAMSDTASYALTVEGVPVGNVKSVSLGVSKCLQLTSGEVRCWGKAFMGNLGDGDTSMQEQLSPVEATRVGRGASKIVEACGLFGGAVKCWGFNGNGELGNGNRNMSLDLADVIGLQDNVTDLSALDSSRCAVREGALWCWGNVQNNLGLSYSQGHYPIQVAGLDAGVTKVAVGGAAVCVLQYGAVKCFGSQHVGVENAVNYVPTLVTGLESGVSDIWAGMFTFCVLQHGAAKCWGSRPGDGSPSSNTPVPVTGLASGVTKIAVGWGEACAIQNGAVKCWGSNTRGNLGIGKHGEHLTPVATLMLTNATDISGGDSTGYCAVEDQHVYCWGINYQGQLGLGDKVDRMVPTIQEE